MYACKNRPPNLLTTKISIYYLRLVCHYVSIYLRKLWGWAVVTLWEASGSSPFGETPCRCHCQENAAYLIPVVEGFHMVTHLSALCLPVCQRQRHKQTLCPPHEPRLLCFCWRGAFVLLHGSTGVGTHYVICGVCLGYTEEPRERWRRVWLQ